MDYEDAQDFWGEKKFSRGYFFIFLLLSEPDRQKSAAENDATRARFAGSDIRFSGTLPGLSAPPLSAVFLPCTTGLPL